MEIEYMELGRHALRGARAAEGQLILCTQWF